MKVRSTAKTETAKSGISTFGAAILMTFTFLFLNLNGIISWPAWAICMPLLVALGFYAIILGLALIILLIAGIVAGVVAWKKKQ